MKIIKGVITIIALILCAIIFIMNLVYISQISADWKEQVTISYLGIGNLFICIFIAMGIIGIGNFIDKKTNKIKKNKMKINICLLVIVFIVYIIITIIWIQVRKATPVADSMRVYEAACQMFRGEEISALKYFELYPQNLSLAYMFSKIFLICNSCNVIILKIVNLISNCLTITAMYFILKILGKDYEISKSRFWIIAFTYIPIILLVNFTYGDFISMAFTMIGMYFAMKYVKDEKIQYIAISSILIMISVILRMNNLIFVIAIAIYLIIGLCTKNEKTYKEKVVQIAFVILFVIIAIIPSNLIKNSLTKKYKLDKEKSFPITGFLAMGMQEGMRANGWYNENADIGWKEIDIADSQYKEMISKRIEELSGNLFYNIKFYCKKVASMWTEPLQESIWQNLSFNFDVMEERTEEETEELERIDKEILKYEKVVQIYQKTLLLIIFGITLFAIIKNRKNISNEMILLMTSFIGGFMFHILWEGKSRYIIPYIIVLIPIASMKLINQKNEKMIEK